MYFIVILSFLFINTGSCSREKVGTVQGLGIFSWPETKVGESATTPCPYNRNVSAARECQYKAIKAIPEILWGPIHAKACRYRHERSQRGIFDLSEVFICGIIIYRYFRKMRVF